MGNLAVKIEIVERDRWSGPKTDDWMVCQTVEDAYKFEKEYNARNTEPTAPEWYMQVEGKPIPIDLSDTQFDKLKSDGRVLLSILKNI